MSARNLRPVFSFLLAFVVFVSTAQADLNQKLQQIQSQGEKQRFNWVRTETDTLIREHDGDENALLQIYKIRTHSARHHGGTFEQLQAEIDKTLQFLPATDFHVRRTYSLWLMEGAMEDQAFFDRYYAQVCGREDTESFELIIAHHFACIAYDRWQRTDEMIEAFNRLMQVADITDDEQTSQVSQAIEHFMNNRQHALQMKYELIGELRSELKIFRGDAARRVWPAVIRAEIALAANDNLIQTAAFLAETFPDEPRMLLARMQVMEHLGRLDEGRQLARRFILMEPLSQDTFDVHTKLMEYAMHEGDLANALGSARVAFGVARDHWRLTRAVQAIAQVIVANDGHLINANKFVLFQRYGIAGPDGAEGTDDDLAPPDTFTLGKIDGTLRDALRSKAEELYDPLDANSLRMAGYCYLNAGLFEQALRMFAMQYMLIIYDRGILTRSADDLLVGLRAATGHAFGADGFVRRQSDIAVPQGETLKQAVESIVLDDAFLQQIELDFHTALTKNLHSHETYNFGIRYAGALMLSGKPDESISVAYSLFSAARDEWLLNMSVMAVASALRSRDMSLSAANAFIDFQTHGPCGKDGVPGSADDLANPLADMQPTLPQDHVAWLKDFISQRQEARNHRDAGYGYLYLLKPAEALVQLKKARSLTAFNPHSLNEMTRDIVVALKAYHGHVFGASEFLAYQKYGPFGEDGVPGTDADLADPLAKF